MAALFDLHCLIALQNSWLRMTGATSTVANGKTNFRRCFPMIEDAAVDSWFDGLQNVKFRSFGSPGADGFPIVIVKLESESPTTEFLGDALYSFVEDGKDKGHVVSGNIVAQEIDVYVATTSHELTRALYTCIRSLMHQLVPTFLAAGYVNVQFQSAQELMPDEQMISEEAGVFVRHSRWRAIAKIESYPLEDGTANAATPWQINLSDITNGQVTLADGGS